MIILRGDGTPTYLHAVVCDDHDMAISHVIRGDDHMTNTFRQSQIYAAMGWERPAFAHLPLIHGPDGAKLSKRHGAQSVVEFREQGYLPEALNNYLLRLGWGHGDAEVLSRDEQIRLFDLDGVGRSASRMDYVKLDPSERRVDAGGRRRPAHRGRAGTAGGTGPVRRAWPCPRRHRRRSASAMLMPGLKERAQDPGRAGRRVPRSWRARSRCRSMPKAQLAADADTRAHHATRTWRRELAPLEPFDAVAGRHAALRRFADAHRTAKLGQVAQPLRAALTGSTTRVPGIDTTRGGARPRRDPGADRGRGSPWLGRWPS